MRIVSVRPFYWYLFAAVCISVLVFAALAHPHTPAVIKVQMGRQNLTSIGLTTLEVHITDSQGLPIPEAQVISTAYMTNMNMVTDESHVSMLETGRYKIQLGLNMAGPWAITIKAQADGFSPQQRTLHVQVA